MAVLVIADHDNTTLRDSTHKTVTAALALSGDVDVLVAGSSTAAIAASAAKIAGVRKVLTEDAEFEAHNFGPFSSKIYQAVETLAAAKLIEDSAKLAQTGEDTWEAEEIVGTEQPVPYVTRLIFPR